MIMLEICFESTAWAEVKVLYSKENKEGEIALCPDNFSIGSLVPFTPQSRFGELVSYGMELPDGFIESYEKLFKLLEDAKEVRVWISDSPHELLGLYFISDYVYPRLRQIHVCSMSFLSKIYEVNCLSCLSDEEWSDLYTYSKVLSTDTYFSLWQQFLKENSKLRIALKGRIVSVGIDYFDNDIIAASNQLKTDDAYVIADAVLNNYTQQEKVSLSIYFFLYRAYVITSKLV